MKSILFVCRHNACRSRIAEAIARRLTPPRWIIESAGVNPSVGIDPKAAAVLKRRGLKISAGPPRGFETLEKREWDFVVVTTDCGFEREMLRAKELVEWLVPDPHDAPDETYDRLYDDLRDRVESLLLRAAV